MAALSSDTTWRDRLTKNVESISPLSLIVKSASVLYRGSFCTIAGATGAEIQPYAGTVTHRAVGWHFHDAVTGNASAPRNTGRIIPGGFQALVPVTGLVTTVVTDYGKKVYISNDADLTLTGTTSTMHVGYVMPENTKVTAGTNAWVYFRNMFGKVGGQ